jgi:hypothetical protein
MSYDISMFDKNQQYVINTFLTGGNINGAVSFKVDGSLFAVSLYEKTTEQATFWTNFIGMYGDDFNKCVLAKCQEMNLPFIVVFSSQGTTLIGSLMQDYTVTSLFNVTNAEKTLTPSDVFSKYGDMFLSKVAAFYNGLLHAHETISSGITMCFETVCKNRTTYLGTGHTELAVIYDKSFYRFLGLSVLDTQKYIPHYQIEHIVHTAGFEQPNYWNISHTSDVDKLMCALGKIIYGTSTVDDFYKENMPHNKYDNASFDYVDIEGFIFYLHTNDGVDYSKIKTPEYYICHKFRESNIHTLIQLSQTASNIFPLCRTVGLFYTDLVEKLHNIGNTIYSTINENKETLKNTLSEKAKASFETQSNATQMKMIVNASNQMELMNLIRPIIINSYPILQDKTFDDEQLGKFNSLVRHIIMQLSPWGDITLNISTLINKMKTDTNCITELFNFLLLQ